MSSHPQRIALFHVSLKLKGSLLKKKHKKNNNKKTYKKQTKKFVIVYD